MSVPTELGPTARRVLAIAALGCAIAYLFQPTLAWLWRSWQAHPYYSHGPLVPVVAVWMAWRRRAEWRGGQPSIAGLALIAAAAAMHLAATRSDLHLLSTAGLLVAVAGAVLLVGGRRALLAASFPIAVLALAVPLPMAEQLATPLAAGAAHAAAATATAVGSGVDRVGAQLSVAGGAFTVGAPCSGLRSLVALGTLAMILAGVSDGSPRRRSLVVAVALPIALILNWLRLTGLLLAAEALGPRRGLALFHGPSSVLLFVLATMLLLALHRWSGSDAPRRAWL